MSKTKTKVQAQTDAIAADSELRNQMERAALELAEGRGAHADPIACLDDLAASTACRKPGGFTHSIAELLAHVNYWMAYDLKRMAGSPDPYPGRAAESWRAIDKINQAEWRAMVDEFRGLLQRLETVCRSDAATWTKQAPAAHPSHERNISTIGGMIFQLIAHNSYHVGQIVDLRRALRVWPPAKGGDTW